jgi:hypothetical protein
VIPQMKLAFSTSHEATLHLQLLGKAQVELTCPPQQRSRSSVMTLDFHLGSPGPTLFEWPPDEVEELAVTNET